MKGHDTFRQAVDRLSRGDASTLLAAAGLGLDDIDVFVYHQANGRILQRRRRAARPRPGERVIDCIDRYGNTSAATIPIALAEAQGDGLLRRRRARAVRARSAAASRGRRRVIEWGRGDAA